MSTTFGEAALWCRLIATGFLWPGASTASLIDPTDITAQPATEREDLKRYVNILTLIVYRALSSSGVAVAQQI